MFAKREILDVEDKRKNTSHKYINKSYLSNLVLLKAGMGKAGESSKRHLL